MYDAFLNMLLQFVRNVRSMIRSFLNWGCNVWCHGSNISIGCVGWRSSVDFEGFQSRCLNSVIRLPTTPFSSAKPTASLTFYPFFFAYLIVLRLTVRQDQHGFKSLFCRFVDSLLDHFYRQIHFCPFTTNIPVIRNRAVLCGYERTSYSEDIFISLSSVQIMLVHSFI